MCYYYFVKIIFSYLYPPEKVVKAMNKPPILCGRFFLVLFYFCGDDFKGELVILINKFKLVYGLYEIKRDI